MITWAQWGFQDAQSPLIEEILYFHDFSFLILCFIFVSIIGFLLKFSPRIRTFFTDRQLEQFFNLIYPFVVFVQILGSLLLLYLTGDDTTMPAPQGYTDGLTSPTQSSFDDYIIPCRELKERSTSLLDISDQAPLYEPANILKMIGGPGHHTPPTGCGHSPSLRSWLWGGIANKPLDIPADPRLKWFLVRLPCIGEGAYGEPYTWWTNYLIRGTSKEDVASSKDWCLTYPCSVGEGSHPGKLIEEVRQDDLRVSRDGEHLLLRGIVGEGNKVICRCVGNVLLFAKDEPCFLTGNANITPGPLFYSVTTQHADWMEGAIIDFEERQEEFSALVERR